MERQLLADEEGRSYLTQSVSDINEVVRLYAATALLALGVPEARRELERLRNSDSSNAMSASIILDQHDNQRS